MARLRRHFGEVKLANMLVYQSNAGRSISVVYVLWEHEGRVQFPAPRQKATFGKIRLRTPPRRMREWNGGDESRKIGCEELKGRGESQYLFLEDTFDHNGHAS